MQLNIGKCQKTPNEKKNLVNKIFFHLVEHPITSSESSNRSGVLARIKHKHDIHLKSPDSKKNKHKVK